uniref:Transposase n=1 Tax=Cereibacter sphaeroides (strain ATCC 17025 / ATH 2.4.3) TaxID=349102 RepID=A4X034_CERS5
MNSTSSALTLPTCRKLGRGSLLPEGRREPVFRVRQHSLEPWLPRLDTEWTAGCRNGADFWRRMQAAGFRGSLRVVTQWATRRRRAETSRSALPARCPARYRRQGRTSEFSVPFSWFSAMPT